MKLRTLAILCSIALPVVVSSPAQNARIPEGVTAHRDLAYVENGHERHRLDLYLPKEAKEPLPLIIWIHGGGWQNGSKEGCPPLRNGYTERGYAVASINYRLSGHATFPAQIEDCKAAIRWLRAHAKEYNLDPNRFGVWGSSAGGHLVALVGTSGDVKDFDKGANLDQSSRVQAVCDYYGPTDFVQFVSTPGYERHAQSESPEAKLLGGAVLENKDKAARANPITYVSKDEPPFLIVHGDEDKTVPLNQSQSLYEALKKAGVSVHFHTIKGAGHGQGFGGPEIEPMVSAFFEARLKSRAPPSNTGEAKTSESVASAGGAAPAGRAGVTAPTGRPGMSWEQVRTREGVADDGRVPRDKFKGPAPLFDRLDRNRDGVLTKDDFADPSTPATPKKSGRAPRDPCGGIFFYAKEGYDTNTAPIANPDVLGNWVQFYWSEIEKEKGRYDWSLIDSRMKPWVDAGKKVAFRVYWVGSGYWRNPAARVATPASVWADGAKFVKHADSGTEIPLAWDPIYKRRASEFLTALAQRYDGNPNILFFDVTPGAETNPYRFLAFNQRTPEFKNQYAATPASDGRKYSDELWQATVREFLDEADKIFKQLPLVVTLNVGTLNLGDARKDYSVEIGQYAVDRGFYVGQNGLSGASYLEDSARKEAFRKWSKRTRMVFETLGDAGTVTAYGKKPLGTLREIVDAANRVNAHYLLPYPIDVLKGTKGQPNYDPEFAAALAYGARTLGKTGATAGAASPDARPQPVAQSVAPTQAAATPEGFHLTGERWTFRDADFTMNGILLKPEGKGPFPAVLISHGLGGSAESFGLNKAREMVKWGVVCIAPDYTHSARFLGGQRGGMPRGVTAGATRGSGQMPANVGASEENIRRAKTCVEILRGLPEVDGKRIGAYGHSMGGFVTIGLAASMPDLIQAAAISGSGVAPQDGFPAPSVEAAEKIRTPFLMLHGSADPVVRPAQSESLKTLLDRNQVPNERYVFEGEGHPIDQTKREQVFARIRDWFTKHGVLPK